MVTMLRGSAMRAVTSSCRQVSLAGACTFSHILEAYCRTLRCSIKQPGFGSLTVSKRVHPLELVCIRSSGVQHITFWPHTHATTLYMQLHNIWVAGLTYSNCKHADAVDAHPCQETPASISACICVSEHS